MSPLQSLLTCLSIF